MGELDVKPLPTWKDLEADGMMNIDGIPVGTPMAPIQLKPLPERKEHYRDSLSSLATDLSEGQLPAHEQIKESIDSALSTVIGWLIGATGEGENVEKTTKPAESLKDWPPGKPILNEAPELSKEDKAAFRREMLGLLKEVEAGRFNIETLILQVFKLQMEKQEEEFDMNKERLVESNRDKQRHVKERAEKMNDILARAQKSKLWGKFETALTAAGLTVAAVGAPSGIGLVALAVGIGALADQMMDDPIKSRIASLVARGDKAVEETWTDRLRLGFGIVAMLASLTAGGMNSAQAALKAAQGATSGMRGWQDHLSSVENADLLQINELLDKDNDNIKKRMKDLNQTWEALLGFIEQLAEIQDKKLNATTALLRA